MAVTNEKSTQLNNVDAAPPVANPAYNDGGRLRVKFFDFTQGAAAGDAGSTVDLVKLPAGKCRVLGALSFIEWSAFGASRVLDIGYTAHTDTDGATVAANAVALDNDINVASAGSAAMGSDAAVNLGKSLELNSKSGVTIQAACAGGTIPAGARLVGYVVYVQD
ncbi:hypothetical protein [Primorskyibacter sedentarius]|uniref:hypothetical protein n=1 Tax=Primorskyibacter sedentarius TaxID=745311 RepID=UPI003EBD7DD7